MYPNPFLEYSLYVLVSMVVGGVIVLILLLIYLIRRLSMHSEEVFLPEQQQYTQYSTPGQQVRSYTYAGGYPPQRFFGYGWGRRCRGRGRRRGRRWR